jgi:hypothetical protein
VPGDNTPYYTTKEQLLSLLPKNLQQVTDAGSSTSNGIFIYGQFNNSLSLDPGVTELEGQSQMIVDTSRQTKIRISAENAENFIKSTKSEDGIPVSSTTLKFPTTNGNRTHTLPNQGGTIATEEYVANVAGTKADLVDGKVPSAQLPSYVDDVIEGYFNDPDFYEDASYINLITPEQGKIYVDISVADKTTTYRWSGSAYIVIDDPLDYASQIEAEGNSENTKVMTPFRVFQNWYKNANEYVLSGLQTATKTIVGAINDLNDFAKTRFGQYLGINSWNGFTSAYGSATITVGNGSYFGLQGQFSYFVSTIITPVWSPVADVRYCSVYVDIADSLVKVQAGTLTNKDRRTKLLLTVLTSSDGGATVTGSVNNTAYIENAINLNADFHKYVKAKIGYIINGKSDKTLGLGNGMTWLPSAGDVTSDYGRNWAVTPAITTVNWLAMGVSGILEAASFTNLDSVVAGSIFSNYYEDSANAFALTQLSATNKAQNLRVFVVFDSSTPTVPTVVIQRGQKEYATIEDAKAGIHDENYTYAGLATELWEVGVISVRKSPTLTNTHCLFTMTNRWCDYAGGGGSASVDLSGYMLKSTYDTNNNGVVDTATNADNLGNQLPSHYATIAGVETLTNKTIVEKRVDITLTGASYTPDTATYNYFRFLNSGFPATINAPTETPTFSKMIMFEFNNSNNQAISWNTIFTDSPSIIRPTGNHATYKLKILYMYNTVSAKWEIIATN